MVKCLAVLSVSVLSFWSAAAAAGSSISTSASDARKTVETAMQAYITALRANDSSAVVGAWAADGVYMGFATPTKRGRAEIESYVSSVYKSNRVDYSSVTIDEVTVVSDIAYVIGTYSVTLHPHDNKEPRSINGRYLYVFRRQGDSRWKIARGVTTDTGQPR